MSLSKVYNFNEETDYTFPADTVKFADGQASLKYLEEALSFAENFSDDTGFAYDAENISVGAGIAKQIVNPLEPSSLSFYANYYKNSADALFALGAPGATLEGSANFSEGFLELYSLGDSAVYDAVGNATEIGSSGTIRIKYRPSFSGMPAAFCPLLSWKEDESNDNYFQLVVSHYTGAISAYFNGSSMRTIAGEPFDFIAGQIYEIEVDYDFVSEGAIRIFVDGALYAESLTTTAYSTANLSVISVGKEPGGTARAQGAFSEVLLFKDVQHTESYTPTNYLVCRESAVILPEFRHTIAGVITALNSLSIDSEYGNVRFNFKGSTGEYKTWSGSEWVDATGTYANATTLADLNAHAHECMMVTDTIYTKIVFPDSHVPVEISNLNLSYSGQTEYSTEPQRITVKDSVTTDQLLSFDSSTTESTTDFVRYTISINDIEMWWNPESGNWEVSAGYTHSNTESELLQHLNDIDCSAGVDVFLNIYIKSDTGNSTAYINSALIEYSFYSPVGDKPAACIVYGHVIDETGTPVQGVSVSVTGQTQSLESTDFIQVRTNKKIQTNSEGAWDMELFQGQQYKLSLEKQDIGLNKSYEITVPSLNSVKLNDLIGG